MPPALRISRLCPVCVAAGAGVAAPRVVAVASSARTSSGPSTWLSEPVSPLPSRPSTATAAPVAAIAVAAQAATSLFILLRFSPVRLTPG
ncbi:hypothetical protein GCM10020001_072330 [Nonomuraea salmonea]